MTRLFDAGETARRTAGERRSREEVRRRAEEIEQVLQEENLLEGTATKLGGELARLKTATQSVQPIVYKSFRKPGSKWMVEHAVSGPDCIFQVFPLKPPALTWQDVIVAMIALMDTIFPRNIVITYTPPDEKYQLKFYTIRITKVVGQPGWERARQRALDGLVEVNAWPT